MADIDEAKRLIAATSPEGLRILGAGVSKPCYQGRYNLAAEAALAESHADLSTAERRLIASFIEGEENEGPRGFMLRVRLSDSEQAHLQALGDQYHLTMSETVRKLIADAYEFVSRIE